MTSLIKLTADWHKTALARAVPHAFFQDGGSDTKLCVRCDERRPRFEFAKHARTSDGLQSWCTPCTSAYAVTWQAANRARISAEEKAKYAAEDAAARMARKRRAAAERRLRVYGLSRAAFDSLVCASEGRCALCERDFRNSNDANIDHCHASGRVRGLLCIGCNVSIGRLGDGPAGLRRALAYVEGRL